jgi:hypothetical protein
MEAWVYRLSSMRSQVREGLDREQAFECTSASDGALGSEHVDTARLRLLTPVVG